MTIYRMSSCPTLQHLVKEADLPLIPEKLNSIWMGDMNTPRRQLGRMHLSWRQVAEAFTADPPL
jgi:endonuclease/exonuclease/phosphatase family metal-dependent hydrolase